MTLPESDEIIYFQYNKIYIIDALSKQDKSTGKELYDDLLKRSEYRHRWFKSEYIRIENKKELIKLLSRIKSDVLKQGIFPIIHIEGHGNENALHIGSSYVMKWQDLADQLRIVNVATKNNLLVSIASCYGSHIYKGIDPGERAPFFGMVAPIYKIGEGELYEGYHIFYDTIINTDDFHGALDKMRDSTDTGPKFTYINCEVAFRVAFEGSPYMQNLKDPAFRKQRTIELAMKGLSDPLIRNTVTIPQLLHNINHALDNSDQYVEAMMNHFTMKDLIKIH